MSAVTADREAAIREANEVCTCHTHQSCTVHGNAMKLAAELAAAREREAEANTRLHSLRWTLGLETHEGEEPQSEEEAVQNLLALRRAALSGGEG